LVLGFYTAAEMPSRPRSAVAMPPAATAPATMYIFHPLFLEVKCISGNQFAESGNKLTLAICFGRRL